jgi:nucleoside-diphosphate-sugar epimerase
MAVTSERSAFVAGATGYTGRALVAELCRRGVRTVAHVRPDSPRLDEWRSRFEAMGAETDTSAWTDAAMADALARVRPAAVFALLGTTRARTRRDGDGAGYDAVDYGLSATLLRATARACPQARFVYLSSVGVGPRARGDYLRVRWRLEQELQQSGVPWTVVRPSFITGPDRAESRPAERIGAVVSDVVLRIASLLGASGLRRRYASMTAEQLAGALADVAFSPAGAGRILHGEDLR